MNTAIIGLGNIGTRVARNLTAGGENIIIADKTLAKAENLASELGGKAKPMPVADAIGKADVVILGSTSMRSNNCWQSIVVRCQARSSSTPRTQSRQTEKAVSRRRSLRSSLRGSLFPHSFWTALNLSKHSAH
jgi:glutamyl-tRNA reductase